MYKLPLKLRPLSPKNELWPWGAPASPSPPGEPWFGQWKWLFVLCVTDVKKVTMISFVNVNKGKNVTRVKALNKKRYQWEPMRLNAYARQTRHQITAVIINKVSLFFKWSRLISVNVSKTQNWCIYYLVLWFRSVLLLVVIYQYARIFISEKTFTK